MEGGGWWRVEAGGWRVEGGVRKEGRKGRTRRNILFEKKEIFTQYIPNSPLSKVEAPLPIQKRSKPSNMHG